MKKKSLSILLLCALPLCACGAPASNEPEIVQAPLASPQEAAAPKGQGGYISVAFMPEQYTDPANITVDESILVRTDGRTPDTEAHAELAAEAEAASLFDMGSWPVNAYTAGLPLPTEGKVSMSGEDTEIPDCFTIVFEGMSYHSFLTYVESLKAAGYTSNASEEDYAVYGMEGINYAASGPDGRTISAMSVSGTTILQISK